jgi:hypothetical protein
MQYLVEISFRLAEFPRRQIELAPLKKNLFFGPRPSAQGHVGREPVGCARCGGGVGFRQPVKFANGVFLPARLEQKQATKRIESLLARAGQAFVDLLGFLFLATAKCRAAVCTKAVSLFGVIAKAWRSSFSASTSRFWEV